MSTGYDLICLDHPDAGGLLYDDWNHGDKELGYLWAAREAVVDAYRKFDAHDHVSLELEVDAYRRVDYSMMSWLATHKDCTVVLLDEYGRRTSMTGLDLAPHHCQTCTCPPGSTRGHIKS